VGAEKAVALNNSARTASSCSSYLTSRPHLILSGSLPKAARMTKRRRSKSKPKLGVAGKLASQMVDNSSRRLEVAHGLWREGRHNDALDLYREAIRQEPNNVQTYVMAARAYAKKFHFDRMEEILRKLVRRAHRHPGVHHYLGETYGMLKLPAKAVASYEHAARLPGALPPTWMELASLYERAHRLDEAGELIERTVRAGFDLPLVWLVRGRIQRRQKQLDKAESTFHDLIEKMPESEWACQAWGELALMKDRQGDYDGAIEAIGHCKKFQMSHEDRLWTASERAHQRVQAMIDDISRDYLRRWRDEAGRFPKQRVALLSGFPRSGTTLLEQVLDAHPDLVSSEERDFVGKELMDNFTSKQGQKSLLEVFDDLRLEQIGPERERYFRAMEYLLGESIDGRMHLDKNPSYNLTLPLMLRVFPETRLIIALRDPRDVVLSCYLRYLPLNAVSVRFLTPERTAQRYALDMKVWLRFREIIDVPWCEVRYEDTVADLAGQARRALETLGLDWSDDVLNYRARLGREKQVTSPTYEAVAEPIYTRAIGRWKNYQKLLEPALDTLEPFIREFGYDA
jgi:tetratricopeptide (TPR) repeat protein